MNCFPFSSLFTRFLITSFLLVVLVSIGCKKKNAANASNSEPEKKQKESEQNSEKIAQPTTNISKSSAKPNATAQATKLNKKPAATLFDLNDIRPGQRHRYQLELSATSGDEERVWSGTFVFRSESQVTEISASSKKINSRVTSNRKLVAKRYGTGIKVPRRWVLVGNEFVEGASKVEVLLDGKVIPATVRKRLKETRFAVLQLEDANFPKIPIPETDEMRKGTNLAWLNANGSLQIKEDVKSTSYSSRLGGQYAFERVVPDNAVGGVAFDANGNITGMIVNSFHPTTDGTSYSRVHPMTRVAKTWGDKSRQMMFATPNEKPRNDLESLLNKTLVQVAVERPVKEDAPFSFVLVSEIKSTQAASGRKVGFHDPDITYNKSSTYPFYSDKRNENNTLRSRHQLPFYLGSLVDQVIFAFVDGESEHPIRITNSGFEFTPGSNSNGIISFKHVESHAIGQTIVGKRKIKLKSLEKSSLPNDRQLGGTVDLQLEHSYELSLDDKLPNKSSSTGYVEIETSNGPQKYDLKLTLTRLQ